MFKTELHCHTKEVSQCSHVSTADAVELYIEKGFSTLVITNHYSQYTVGFADELSWKEKNEGFLSAYEIAKSVARGRINILLGMEFRNIYSINDYLVYGVTEEFIMKYGCDENNLFLNMHLKDFCNLAHDNNMLVYQAHPFRNGMTVINPGHLDGIEILNGHRRHDSRNDIAKLWAKKHNLLTCGGSDFHEKGDEGTVSLLTSNVITDNDSLLKALRSKPRFKLLEDNR